MNKKKLNSESIIEITNTYKTGLFNLSADEKSKLFEKTEKLIGETADWEEKQIDVLTDLFLMLESAEVLHQFAEKIDPQIFYNFGKKLMLNQNRQLIFSFVDIFRTSSFLQKIYGESNWADLIVGLLKTANYNFNVLFNQRVQKYSDKTLFSVIEGVGCQNYSWADIAKQVSLYSRGLFALNENPESPGKVAFLTVNSMDMVLFDLACLTSGIVNIMIPANLVPAHIEYILKITKPTVLIVANDEQLEKISKIRTSLDFLKAIIILSEPKKKEKWLFTIGGVKEKASNVADEAVQLHAEKIGFDDLISIMFTSGTTGNPKGIMFSHKNIVFKRFARAMALPKIGEDDVFLSYLPLFHTFGRWLEMTGSIFWAAKYVFMENPAPETMIENMRMIKPTIFISIPKKWYQLYEHVERNVDLVQGTDSEIKKIVDETTGGKLRWGLSAAGHLDSDIFRFFQQNGVELMSGFGMTEATGGITMTPPGKYNPNSLGIPLPGIQIKLAEDGELWIKGPYVMEGYVNPEEVDTEMLDGWFPTGDIMKMEQDGSIQIIDRKKEIYKNIKGETIAPQKIENYFREFEFIKHVFLVGDHKPYNTLLIYPNYECENIDFTSMNADELNNYFSSVVVSVNRFLSPFERIVDFAIIERDFSTEKNELTPKGTYRRRVVETNFEDVIEPLYARNYTPLNLGGLEIRVPAWFIREQGLTSNDVFLKKNMLSLKDSKWELQIKKENGKVQVGSNYYIMDENFLDLGKFLINPYLWLGNEELINFASQKIFMWYRLEEGRQTINFYGQVIAPPADIQIKEQLQNLFYKQERSLIGIHLASLLIQVESLDGGLLALDYLNIVAKETKLEISPLAVEILKRSIKISPIEIQRIAFLKLVELIPAKEFELLTTDFLQNSIYFINPGFISSLCNLDLNEDQLSAFFRITKNYCRSNDQRCFPLFELLSKYGSLHPTRFKIIRQFLANSQLGEYDYKIKQSARKSLLDLRQGFRDWLGEKQHVAVDVETGEEYTWKDVMIFDEEISEEDKSRLSGAIINTKLLREAVFLFSSGVLIRLNDIPSGGVWISQLGSHHGKSVFRVTVQTRFHGSFDLAVNLNHDLNHENVLEEINWLIQSGTTAGENKLVEDYGGFWDQYDLWSEEFIPGETVGKFLKRMGKQKDETTRERVQLLWPHFIFSGIAAYVKFWEKSGRRLELDDPSPENVIIPAHDYQIGTRIVSISARKFHNDPLSMLLNFYKHFVYNTEKEYPLLEGIGKWMYIFSAFLETLGQNDGLSILEECLENIPLSKSGEDLTEVEAELKKYISNVQTSGFIPKRLYFAIKRYKRWLALNVNATTQARAAMLSELYETYQLHLLENQYPETRTRFFADTVFAGCPEKLMNNLEEIIAEQRNEKMSSEKLTQYISAIQNQLTLDEDMLFFLARLTYPHLSPTDSADLISLETGGVAHADLVVSMDDYDGNTFRLRTPVSPKEITRLHQLFISNNLSVQFSQEHRYLVAVNERGHLIGGLFYKKQDEHAVHIEKIVVSDSYRKLGVSDGILNEFFKRMKFEKYDFVTTGFFRPEYFYRFGFKIEKKYAGLVKDLRKEETSAENTVE